GRGDGACPGSGRASPAAPGTVGAVLMVVPPRDRSASGVSGCSGEELGVELAQPVAAVRTPGLDGGIELADVCASAGDVDDEIVDGLTQRAELRGLLDLYAVEQRVLDELGLSCHPLRGVLDVVGELHLGVDDRRLGEELVGGGHLSGPLIGQLRDTVL